MRYLDFVQCTRKQLRSETTALRVSFTGLVIRAVNLVDDGNGTPVTSVALYSVLFNGTATQVNGVVVDGAVQTLINLHVSSSSSPVEISVVKFAENAAFDSLSFFNASLLVQDCSVMNLFHLKVFMFELFQL